MSLKSYGKISTGAARYENNTWLRATTSRTIVVFVHGIMSNSNDCWRKGGAGVPWPVLTADDGVMEGASVFLAGYESGLRATNVGVADSAQRVYDALANKVPLETVQLGTAGTPKLTGGGVPLDRDRILFVCHSLGGLVVRQLLVEHQPAFEGKAVGLLLCASPTAGSFWANFTWFFAGLIKHKLALQLRPGNESLVALDRRFRKLLRDSSREKLDGRELIETKSMVLRLPWLRIVSSDSATRYFQGQHIASTTHASLVKPDSTDSAVHLGLRAVARDMGFLGRKACANALQELAEALGELSKVYAPDYGATWDDRANARSRVQKAATRLLANADCTDRLTGLKDLPLLARAGEMEEADQPYQGFKLDGISKMSLDVGNVLSLLATQP